MTSHQQNSGSGDRDQRPEAPTAGEAEKKVWPCSLIEGHVTPCWALGEVLQHRGRGTKAQGLEFQTLVNMETLEHSRDLVVLKSGNHGKKGLTLNFCPFCREELLAGVADELAAATPTLSSNTRPSGSPDPLAPTQEA